MKVMSLDRYDEVCIIKRYTADVMIGMMMVGNEPIKIKN
jgi:hypothetical protein